MSDELERLRAADPIDPASMPSATAPPARALFERITMNRTDLSDPVAPPVRQSNRGRRLALLAAGVVVLGAAVGGAFAVTDDDSHTTAAATAPTTSSTSAGPITPGGAIASCVEKYDLDTLRHRELAFDGVVQAVAGDDISFAVNRWYRGGGAEAVTLGGAEVLGGLSSAGPGAPLLPGTRLLVSGDGGFAWSCGFTQAYDPAVAADWQAAFQE